MGMLRTDFTKGMLKDMYAYFFESYDEKPTVYDQLFKVEPSDAAFEQSTSVISVGQLSEKAEGSPIVYRNISEGFTTYGDNHTFADGLEISMEAVEDHKKIDNILRKAAQGWGTEVNRTRETYYAKTLNKSGFTAGNDHFKNPIAGQNANGLIYDGKPLIALSGNNHTSKGGGTYYNGIASTLSQANLITAHQLFTNTNNRDERDEIIDLRPDTLVVPPALEMTARVILNSTQLPGSTNNDINVMSGIVNLVVWPYLTTATSWFLMRKQSGLIAQNRKAPVIDFYQDEDTKGYKANIIARWGVRVDNWRFIVGSNAPTS
jgi:hypothetical protein